MNIFEQTLMDWQQGMPSVTQTGGLAVAHCQLNFLADAQGMLFPREWLRAQLAEYIIAEQGIGHLNGEAVFVFELAHPVELSAMHWQIGRESCRERV